MAATLGSEHALDLLRLANAAKEALKARIRSCAIKCDFRSGYVFVGLRPSPHAALRAMADYWRLQLGMRDAYFLAGGELHEHVRSPLYQCGLLDPTAGTFDPIKLLTALARRLRDFGGLLFEGSRARRISDQRANCIIVETDDGSVLADHVVICTNACHQTLFAPTSRSIIPVTCSAIATNPLDGSDIREILPTRISGSDWRMAPDYWTVTADNRILFGNGGFHLRPLTTNNPSRLAQRLGRIFPPLRGVTVDRCWHGTIAMTRGHLPDIGRRGRNVWVARGYNGVGLALAYYAGVLIADAITGRTDAIKTFERIPSRYFPTGYLRLPALLMDAFSPAFSRRVAGQGLREHFFDPTVQ
jgi:gamma-glutamylputrescine oxidase